VVGSDTPFTKSLAALSRFFVGDGTLEQTLTRVVDLSVEAVEAADMVGITMVVEGRNRTAVYTDELAPEIDEAQYEDGEGPCVQAFEQQRVMSITSTRDDGPWPEFRQAALAHGIHSTLSLPLVVDQRSMGALNLYSRQEGGFDEDDQEIAELFASQAAIVLANSQAFWDARALNIGLGEAMKNRAVIEQAKGILMARQHCAEDEAFDLLVRASQRENIKLRTVAQRIVDNASKRTRSADPLEES
jgi:GAF domain-containing protein